MEFIALGATDSVGASCYFLQVDGLNLLLDCGKGFIGNGGKTFGPDFTPLIPKMLTSLSQLDAVFISHGHYDHIGYLPEMIRQCPDTPIYATHLTQKLGWYLMMDRYDGRNDLSVEQKIGAETSTRQALNRIQPLNYLQSVRIKSVQITFYEAGHIPGAAMILIESQREGKLLYTGDFRRSSSRLTPGYCLSAKVHPDVILMCGLHAKHPRYTVPDDLNGLLTAAGRAIHRHEPCLIPTRELTKGLEIVGFLAEKMKDGELPSAPIFMDDHIWMLSERFRENGISVLGEQCHRFPQLPLPREPGIYVGGNGYRRCFRNVCAFDFSLHAGYADCSALLHHLRPRTVILVHSPRDSTFGHYGDTALEAEHPGIAFIYPTVGYPYHLTK